MWKKNKTRDIRTKPNPHEVSHSLLPLRPHLTFSYSKLCEKILLIKPCVRLTLYPVDLILGWPFVGLTLCQVDLLSLNPLFHVRIDFQTSFVKSVMVWVNLYYLFQSIQYDWPRLIVGTSFYTRLFYIMLTTPKTIESDGNILIAEHYGMAWGQFIRKQCWPV